MATFNKLIGTCRATEICSVSGDIIAEYKKGDWSADTYLTDLFQSLIPATELLLGSIKRVKTKSDLEEKDKIRDEKLKAIHHIVTGFLYHPDTAIQTAAQKVAKIFNNYGVDITRKSYVTESSLINSLLLDFSEETIYAAIVNLPGLNPMVEELKIAEKAFNDEAVLYLEKKAEEKTKQTATEIKKEVKKIINDKLVVYLRAMAQAREDTYGVFAATVAQIINDNNRTVKKRRRGKSKED